MKDASSRRARRDWWIALALVLIVFALGLAQLTRGVPYWGDDSAGYVSEGIAIARGELDEQAARNLQLHPTPLTSEADGAGGLVYAWGFPLLLSLVYRLTGFDAVDYSNVILYKLPSLVCLSLLAGALYLFLRRRFSRRTAAPAALIFCLTGDFLNNVNILYSDVCFLLFAVLSLLLIDLFLDSARAGTPGVARGLLLGAALWYTYEVRLNGVALWLTALCAQLIFLAGGRERRSPAALARHLIPHAAFLALRLLSERLLLPATANLSEVGAAGLRTVLYHVFYYGYFAMDYLNSLTGFRLWVGVLLAVPCIAGFVRDGFRRENLHLTLMFLGTVLVNLTLPYGQRLRYLYGALPVLLLYLLWGCRRIAAWLEQRRKGAKRAARSLGAAVLALVLVHAALAGAQNLACGGAPEENEMYAAQSVEMYRYICEHVPKDASIACAKPRALYLNTGRMGWRAGYNGHALLDADYYLCILSDDFAERNLITDDIRGRFEPLYATSDLGLYRILPE